MDNNAPAAVSVEEAAQILGVDRNTVYRSIHRGEVYAIRLCARFRIPKREVNRLLGHAYYPEFPVGQD